MSAIDSDRSRVERKVIRSVLLDLDGTLIDSNRAHAKAWQDALTERGKTVSYEEAHRVIGMGTDQLLPLFLSEQEISEWGDELIERRGEIFKERYLQTVGPIPGAREFVYSLLERGLKVSLGSSAAPEELQQLAQAGGVVDLPIPATTSGDADKSKPEPDIWLAAMEGLGGEPETTAIVGDTPYDIEAAKKGGLKAIGVLTGGWSREELEAAGADEVYPDVSQLNARLGDSLLGRGDAL